MSPYEIKLLLNIYCIANWHQGRDEPILPETLFQFRRDRLITGWENYQDVKLTGKGRAHVIQLCNLLPPTEKTLFIDQFGNVIPDPV